MGASLKLWRREEEDREPPQHRCRRGPGAAPDVGVDLRSQVVQEEEAAVVDVRGGVAKRWGGQGDPSEGPPHKERGGSVKELALRSNTQLCGVAVVGCEYRDGGGETPPHT